MTTRTVTFSVNEGLKNNLYDFAKRQDVSVSEVVRRAVEDYLGGVGLHRELMELRTEMRELMTASLVIQRKELVQDVDKPRRWWQFWR